MKNGFFSIKKILFSLIFAFLAFFSYGDDWILAAQKFDFAEKNSTRTSSLEAQAELLPRLILEKLASELTRYSPQEEIAERELSNLTTERLSLFLQLSKEVKTRDSLILSSSDSKTLKKNIAAEEKKIKEIQDKIDENLKKSEEIRKRISPPKNSSPENDFSGGRKFFDRLSKFFTDEKEDESQGKNENVKLYKDSESVLFDPGKISFESSDFEKKVLSEKINALLKGVITSYGNYASVTVSLYIFPGKNLQGTITEVGSLDDFLTIASNIAFRLVPLITNNLPVEIFITLSPEECAKNVKLSVDGVVHKGIPEKLTVSSGLHKIQFECEGYLSKSFSYNFSSADKFHVYAVLSKENLNEISFNLLNPANGKFYANGKYAGDSSLENPGTLISVNGENVLGQFVSEEHSVKKVKKQISDENGKTKTVVEEEKGDALSFFYFIPSNLQQEERPLAVKTVAQDNHAVIEKRRIWTYRGYSALVLSLPVTIFTSGKYLAAGRAYSLGRIDDYNEVLLWNTMRYGGLALTGASAGFFVYEIVRYLVAANSVLPKNVKPVDSDEIKTSIESLPSFEQEKKFESLENNLNEDKNINSEEENFSAVQEVFETAEN